jgi:hypothetical protein
MKLEKWEEKCQKCNGNGYCKGPNVEWNFTTTYTCTKCFGVGKIDWLEKIFGKRLLKMYTGIVPPQSAHYGDICFDTISDHYQIFSSMGWIKINKNKI